MNPMQKESTHLDFYVKSYSRSKLLVKLKFKLKQKLSGLGHVEGVKAQGATTYPFGTVADSGPGFDLKQRERGQRRGGSPASVAGDPISERAWGWAEWIGHRAVVLHISAA